MLFHCSGTPTPAYANHPFPSRSNLSLTLLAYFLSIPSVTFELTVYLFLLFIVFLSLLEGELLEDRDFCVFFLTDILTLKLSLAYFILKQIFVDYLFGSGLNKTLPEGPVLQCVCVCVSPQRRMLFFFFAGMPCSFSYSIPACVFSSRNGSLCSLSDFDVFSLCYYWLPCLHPFSIRACLIHSCFIYISVTSAVL